MYLRAKWNIDVFFKLLMLTPWRRVLEKLTGSQLAKKSPAFYRNRKIHSPYPSHINEIHAAISLLEDQC
jgi:hypothetical protein